MVDRQATDAPFGNLSAEPWPPLVRFDLIDLPPFPTEVLPEVLQRFVEQESHATQTPPDLAGLVSMAVCSAAIARHAQVEARPGWVEPVNLYITVLLEPANRKSAVFSDSTKPLFELERELIAAARPDVARRQSERRQQEVRLKRLERKAGETDDAEAALAAEVLAAELANEPLPVLPRLVVDDATAEKLEMTLAEQGGRIASMSAEGGVFDLMAGLYSKNGLPQFGVYLKGHAGDDLRIDRVSRLSLLVERPALTCAYTVQPQVLRGLAKNPAFRGRGLLARFLYAAPVSLIGRRKIGAQPMSQTTRHQYHGLVRSLTAVPAETMLYLSKDANALLQAWESEIEPELAGGGQLELIQDWAGKLAGGTIRLAAVLHLARDVTGKVIEARDLDAAIHIGRYLIPHAKYVLTMMNALDGIDEVHAQSIVWWILRHEKRLFSKTECQHQLKHRFPRVSDLEPALRVLEDRGYIRLRAPVSQKTGPGRSPSPVYEVNPSVFASERAEKHSRYSQNAVEPPESGNSGNNGNGNGGPEPRVQVVV
ncbi:MAG: YfjI family protein [Pirellulales bacterium]